MTELLLALALMMVIEGALYALFPEGMQRMMRMILTLPPSALRNTGLIFAGLGVFIVWLIRG